MTTEGVQRGMGQRGQCDCFFSCGFFGLFSNWLRSLFCRSKLIKKKRLKPEFRCRRWRLIIQLFCFRFCLEGRVRYSIVKISSRILFTHAFKSFNKLLFFLDPFFLRFQILQCVAYHRQLRLGKGKVLLLR